LPDAVGQPAGWQLAYAVGDGERRNQAACLGDADTEVFTNER